MVLSKVMKPIFVRESPGSLEHTNTKTGTQAKRMAYFKYIYKALFEQTPEIYISTVFKGF